MIRTALSIAALAVVLSSVACAAPGDDSDGRADNAQQAQTSTGFVCNGKVCTCDENAPWNDPIDGCAGMSDFCDKIGPGMLCSPQGWCRCVVWAEGGGAIEAEPQPPPRRPRVATGSAGKAGASREP